LIENRLKPIIKHFLFSLFVSFWSGYSVTEKIKSMPTTGSLLMHKAITFTSRQ